MKVAFILYFSVTKVYAIFKNLLLSSFRIFYFTKEGEQKKTYNKQLKTKHLKTRKYTFMVNVLGIQETLKRLLLIHIIK
jgi:hypothetical protein